MKLSKPKLIANPKQHLKSYSFLSLAANILIALAYGASLAFGMGLATLSPAYIIGAMGVVAVMGGLGKFLKQKIGDKEDD